MNIVRNTRILGVVLDTKITFNYHVTNIISKCENGINILRNSEKKLGSSYQYVSSDIKIYYENSLGPELCDIRRY